MFSVYRTLVFAKLDIFIIVCIYSCRHQSSHPFTTYRMAAHTPIMSDQIWSHRPMQWDDGWAEHWFRCRLPHCIGHLIYWICFIIVYIYIYVYRCIVCLQHLLPCSCSPDHLWHHFCLDKNTVPLKSVGPEAPTCAAYHNIVRMQGLKPTYIHFQATFPNKHHTQRHLIHITLQKLSEPWSQPVVFFSWVAVRKCEYLALTHATQ